MTDQLLFTLDGNVVGARPGETIWQVAQREGIDIPHLCWLPEPSYRADGNCRACMVEIEGERVLAAWSWSFCWPTSRRARSLLIASPSFGTGPRSRALKPRDSPRTAFPSRTSLTLPWQSISTPASIAG